MNHNTPAQEPWALCIYINEYKRYEVPAEGLYTIGKLQLVVGSDCASIINPCAGAMGFVYFNYGIQKL